MFFSFLSLGIDIGRKSICLHPKLKWSYYLCFPEWDMSVATHCQFLCVFHVILTLAYLPSLWLKLKYYVYNKRILIVLMENWRGGTCAWVNLLVPFFYFLSQGFNILDWSVLCWEMPKCFTSGYTMSQNLSRIPALDLKCNCPWRMLPTFLNIAE